MWVFPDLQINGYPLKLKKSSDNIGHDAADVLVKAGALKQGELGIIGIVIATHSIHYFFPSNPEIREKPGAVSKDSCKAQKPSFEKFTEDPGDGVVVLTICDYTSSEPAFTLRFNTRTPNARPLQFE